MADKKKPPPANVEELKARLGLTKKQPVQQTSPGGGVPAPGRVSAPPPVIGAPGAKPPPGVAPPPFVQQQKAAPDMHRDPFSGDVGAEMARQSLVEGPKPEDQSVSVEDQKKIAKRARNMTIIISAAVGISCLFVGIFWGRGFSSRLIYNLSIEDGKKLYDIIQYSSKTLSDLKTKMVSAQQKANKTREVDYPLTMEMKNLAKGGGCAKDLSGNEKCILRLQDIANRSYNIYRPEIVQTLFTYASQWNELLNKMEEHAIKTKNDKPALDNAKEIIKKLLQTDYGIVFTKKTDPQTNEETVYGNIAIIAAPITEGDYVKGFKMQGDTGMPTVDKQLYRGGDLLASPEDWVIPLGAESKQGLIAKQKISHFIEYQKRLQSMIELANQMDTNQKSLLISIGEIASLDKKFAF